MIKQTTGWNEQATIKVLMGWCGGLDSSASGIDVSLSAASKPCAEKHNAEVVLPEAKARPNSRGACQVPGTII